MRRRVVKIWFLLSVMTVMHVNAQISPGELSDSHAHLKGMSNCTKCHVLGEKETTSKCLECHTEIKNLQDQKRGYHASQEVKSVTCASCHGEHFGSEFQMIKFDKNSFDHNITGYKLEGKHENIECDQCHKPGLIKYKISQNKGFTYLGLGTECLSCHTDYHQNTLSANCLSCHSQTAFLPATGFNHNNTKYPLKGKHTSVDCVECHKKEMRNGADFQQFSGVAFSNCTDCHSDVHNNRFGNNCTQCHTVESFQQVKNINGFNHDKTDFPLIGKHQNVDCKECHTSSYTKPLKHNECTDCHIDYHVKQFQKNGISPDCEVCHTINGYTPSLFTIDNHNQLDFKLEGAHLATPCFTCHKTENKWDFSIKGELCTDCHEDIHKGKFDKKYISDENCKNCHTLESWAEISFDHNQTGFLLEGKHTELTCRECHFITVGVETIQQFIWESQSCTNCHEDKHKGQFAENGITICDNCHTVSNWEPTKFNHDNTRFKLDGEHINVSCVECHKPEASLADSYFSYKFDDISCTSCHLQ